MLAAASGSRAPGQLLHSALRSAGRLGNLGAYPGKSAAGRSEARAVLLVRRPGGGAGGGHCKQAATRAGVLGSRHRFPPPFAAAGSSAITERGCARLGKGALGASLRRGRLSRGHEQVGSSRRRRSRRRQVGGRAGGRAAAWAGTGTCGSPAGYFEQQCKSPAPKSPSYRMPETDALGACTVLCTATRFAFRHPDQTRTNTPWQAGPPACQHYTAALSRPLHLDVGQPCRRVSDHASGQRASVPHSGWHAIQRARSRHSLPAPLQAASPVCSIF